LKETNCEHVKTKWEKLNVKPTENYMNKNIMIYSFTPFS